MSAQNSAGSRLVRVNERGYPVGQDHHRSKLTDHDVDLILALLDDGMSHRQVAAKFEVSRAQVGRIALGKQRSQLIVQTVRRRIPEGHPVFMPADLSEFDFIGGF